VPILNAVFQAACYNLVIDTIFLMEKCELKVQGTYAELNVSSPTSQKMIGTVA
jgi:hypothetical protein